MNSVDENFAEGKFKAMSCGLYDSCPASIRDSLDFARHNGFHFIITRLTHPNYELIKNDGSTQYKIGRNDRILRSNEWNRLIVGELNNSIEIDNEVPYIRKRDRENLNAEIDFAIHLGIPAILIHLNQPENIHLARMIQSKLIKEYTSSVWILVPMVHPSKFSVIADKAYDSWEIWNDFRIACDYDRRIGLVLELPKVDQVPAMEEIDRWIGEAVKAIVIPASFFLRNQYDRPVLAKAHQEIIRRFMSIDVQYIIKRDVDADLSLHVKYISYLGKKFYTYDSVAQFIEGCEDYLQIPLQPLSENLESGVYEVFEKDKPKYVVYQNAIESAIRQWSEERPPVVVVVGAGRGPLVQAVINVSIITNKKIKIYAIEKNPYAVNTLSDRVEREWGDQVTLIREDIRNWKHPEEADIIVSELLGSFGDNELSPECLNDAQRILRKDTGISIPFQYTSFIAPLQSLKIYNEIRHYRPPDSTLKQNLEMPYVVHLVNYQQLAAPLPLFTFTHPTVTDSDGKINNRRSRTVRFRPNQISTVLTGFVGYFESVLYGEHLLSTHPTTHTPQMVSWFPIIFSLAHPIYVKAGEPIQVTFWREEDSTKVWYEWCLEAPVKMPIMNPHGRSYHIKKY